MKIPIIADFTKKIATDYGVLKEDEGVAYRGLFIIDPKQVVRQITINDLPVGRNVDEVVRLVEAFQFTDEVCIRGLFFVVPAVVMCLYLFEKKVCSGGCEPWAEQLVRANSNKQTWNYSFTF